MGRGLRQCVVALAVVATALSACADRDLTNAETLESRQRARALIEAVDGYFAEFGEYPESVDHLIPARMSQEPTDAIGRPFSYRVVDESDQSLFYDAPYVISFRIRDLCSCGFYPSPPGSWWECSCGHP